MNTTAVRALPRLSNGVPAWMQTKEITSPTTNYAIFKFDEVNRPIDPKHLAELIEAIKVKNLLREYPIVVDRNMVIIDGQHRAKAAEALNFDLHFIVSQSATINDIGSTTRLVSKWNSKDYLGHFCRSGFEEYIKFRAFCEKYPSISMTILQNIAMSQLRKHQAISQAFSSGTFVANNLIVAEKTVQAAIDFKPYINFWNTQGFILAVRAMVVDPLYDHARMLSKMQYVSTRLVRCSRIDDYMRVLSDIYNWKVEKKNLHVLTKMQG